MKAKNVNKRRIFIIISSVFVVALITVMCILFGCGSMNTTNNQKSGITETNYKMKIKYTSEDEISYKKEHLFVNSQLVLSADKKYKYKDIEKIAHKYKGKIVGYLEFSNDYQIEFENMGYDELNNTKELLLNQLDNTSITLNTVIYQKAGEDEPSDEFVESDKNGNWWRDAIHLTELEKDNNDYENVNIGIYDTLFDTDNEDLKYAMNSENIWYNDKDVIEVTDGGEHGTNVSGFLAAQKNNDYGIDGVANNVNIYGYAYRGKTEKFNPLSIMEIKYWNAKLLAKGVKVINMSAGSDELLVAAQNNMSYSSNTLMELAKSIGEFYRKYIDEGYEFVVVKSAGNDNGYDWIKCTESKDHPYGVKKYSEKEDGNIEDCKQLNDVIYEAKYDIWGAITDYKVKNRIIIVGSSTKDTLRAEHSVNGERVDIYAPGERLRELTGNTPSAGTSYAAPMVAGTVSLMWGINPNIPADKIKYLLVSSATEIIEGEDYQISPEDGNFTKMYKCLLDVRSAVDNAQKSKTTQNTKKSGTSYVMGIARLYKDGKFEYNKEGCKISIYNDDDSESLYKEIETDKYGEFETQIESGDYIIVAETKDESYKSDRFVFSIEDSDVKYINELIMYDTNLNLGNNTFKHNQTLVGFEDAVYYVDDDGLWKNTGESESECLHQCSATNIASNGEVIYYSVYKKESSGYCEEYSRETQWKQYDLYCYDLRTSSDKKITSFVECGKPIGVYNNVLYYTDRPDDFTGNVAGVAQCLFSYNLSTGKKNFISKGADQLEMFGTYIYYRDMDAAAGDSILFRYDMANDKIKQITKEEVMSFSISGNSLFYYTKQYKTELDSNNKYLTKVTCQVYKFNLSDGTVERIFDETNDKIEIQYVDEDYLYYAEGGSDYSNYRITLSTGEKARIQYKSRGDLGSFRMDEKNLYHVLKYDTYALYYSGWDSVYFYQVNDNDRYAVPYNGIYSGYRFVDLCNDGVYIMKLSDDGHKYILRYKFDRKTVDFVGIW